MSIDNAVIRLIVVALVVLGIPVLCHVVISHYSLIFGGLMKKMIFTPLVLSVALWLFFPIRDYINAEEILNNKITAAMSADDSGQAVAYQTIKTQNLGYYREAHFRGDLLAGLPIVIFGAVITFFMYFLASLFGKTKTPFTPNPSSRENGTNPETDIKKAG